ncbi:hypothetical protein QQF64_028724 [Cirrhinus molitorella]
MNYGFETNCYQPLVTFSFEVLLTDTKLKEMEKYMNESFDMDECCSELHHSKMDDRIAKASALNSILKELLDEKISTQRKNHWILGPEDLNDTLVYDFKIEEA